MWRLTSNSRRPTSTDPYIERLNNVALQKMPEGSGEHYKRADFTIMQLYTSFDGALVCIPKCIIPPDDYVLKNISCLPPGVPNQKNMPENRATHGIDMTTYASLYKICTIFKDMVSECNIKKRFRLYLTHSNYTATDESKKSIVGSTAKNKLNVQKYSRDHKNGPYIREKRFDDVRALMWYDDVLVHKLDTSENSRVLTTVGHKLKTCCGINLTQIERGLYELYLFDADSICEIFEDDVTISDDNLSIHGARVMKTLSDATCGGWPGKKVNLYDIDANVAFRSQTMAGKKYATFESVDTDGNNEELKYIKVSNDITIVQLSNNKCKDPLKPYGGMSKKVVNEVGLELRRKGIRLLMLPDQAPKSEHTA